MNISLNFIESLMILAKTESFSQTADILKVSQPCISKQIKQLEDELGFQLFVRTKRKAVLTEQAHNFLKKLSPHYAAIREIIGEVKGEREKIAGHLRFASFTEIGQTVFMQYLLEFQQKHPQITLDVDFLKAQQIVEKILNGEIDFGVVEEAPDKENIISFELMDEHLILITSNNNNKTFKQYSEIPLIMYKFLNEGNLQKQIKQYKKIFGFNKHKIIVTVNSHLSMLDSVIQTGGFAVVPEHFAEKYIRAGQIKKVTNEKIHGKLYLIHHYNPMMELKFKKFKEFLIRKSRKM